MFLYELSENKCIVSASVCVCVCERERERENETLALLPPTGSCNPLCFGDLGNLVTKHSRCRFD